MLLVKARAVFSVVDNFDPPNMCIEFNCDNIPLLSRIESDTNDNFACKKVLQAGYGLQDLNAIFTFRAVRASDRS